jgi:hypothetical protein
MRRRRWGLVLLLALASPALAGPVRCTTYEVKSLGRWQTLCSDGTRVTSRYNTVLDRWETTVTPPPGQTCTGRLNPTTHQWEGGVDDHTRRGNEWSPSKSG